MEEQLLQTGTQQQKIKTKGEIKYIYLSKVLSTENLKVTSFCQEYKDPLWVNKKINEENNIKIENAILNKAKKLRLQSS